MITQVINGARKYRVIHDGSFFVQRLPNGSLIGPFDDFFEACDAAGIAYANALRLAIENWNPVSVAEILHVNNT